jgi:hypothetical protein
MHLQAWLEELLGANSRVQLLFVASTPAAVWQSDGQPHSPQAQSATSGADHLAEAFKHQQVNVCCN